jgi:hypothetical protein
VLSQTPELQEFFWDDLLEFIDEGKVIPIVGAELLTVPDGAGGEIPLHRLLAEKLAERLRLPAGNLTGDDALHLVVCRYLERGGRREEVYPRIRNLLKEIAPSVPEPLRQLARIRHFNVFVSTTFDSLLERALDESALAEPPGPCRWPTPPTMSRICRPTRGARSCRPCFTCWARFPRRPTS